MNNSDIKQGQIIKMRNRLWRVDEFSGQEFVATPINGNSGDKRTFLAELENIQKADLEPVSAELMGDFTNQQLLLRAYRFSLLHGSAPFLSLQRSSVVPYNYQMVPLVLALEKPTCRLLLADDVGLGKTIEAGLIISELVQRGNIKRILILTPANLKEQWKDSLDYFFHIDSKIISSFTQKEYEKELPAGANPWQYFQVVIASIDYAKNPDMKLKIAEQKWDLLLVDEAHLCARPHANHRAAKQMKRYELARDLALKIPNVLFLTATPHNGYTDSFASILEMLNPEIISYRSGDDVTIFKDKARFNVCQRNRAKLEAWYLTQGKKSPFPKRNQEEAFVEPDGSYLELVKAVEAYGDAITSRFSEDTKEYNVAGWVSTHLQKRVISSPNALLVSVKNRLDSLRAKEESTAKAFDEGQAADLINDQAMEDDRTTEETASQQLDKQAIHSEEETDLLNLIEMAEAVKPKDDNKLNTLKKELLPSLLDSEKKIIVFTKYKDTLTYLEQNLKFTDVQILIIHGDLSFIRRQEVFAQFDRAKKAILVATDVISEGLNLQRLSSCIIHYELPWNPNRLEQRNGRIDRIGQQKDIVQIRTMVMENSMDKDILSLLWHKKTTIEKDRDYSGNYFGDDDFVKTKIKEITKKRRNRRKYEADPNQLSLFIQEEEKEYKAGTVVDSEKQKRIEQESFYDSLNIDLPEIDKRIEETIAIVGSQKDVKDFIESGLKKFNSGIQQRTDGFYNMVLNDNRLIIPKYGSKIEKVSFDPEDGLTDPDVIVIEIGHPLVRRLIDLVKAEFFINKGSYGRNAYYFSDKVDSVHFIYHALIRYIVGYKDKRVIEELVSFGIDSYSGKPMPDNLLKEIVAARTTRSVDANDLKEMLNDALKSSVYQPSLAAKAEEKKVKLIEERQELYKKIVRETESKEYANWADEMIHIQEVGADLLTVTIVYPLN